MLGFGKNKATSVSPLAEDCATSAAAPARIRQQPANPACVAALLAAVGRQTRLTLTPESPLSFRVTGFDRPDVTLTLLVETNPLRLHAVADWHGVIPNNDVLENNLTVNEWNANFSWPRLQIGLDAHGTHRLSADSYLSGAAGWTVRQLNDWILHAAGGAVGVANFAQSVWPDAKLIEPVARIPMGADAAIVLRGSAPPVETVEVSDPATVAQLSEPGNPYHLVAPDSGLMTVTPELLAEIFVGGEHWHESLVSAGDGVQHASFEWKGDKVDMTVHNAVMTVETGVVLEAGTSEDLLEQMLSALTEYNLSPQGDTLSLVNVGADEPRWLLRSLLHVPAKSGMNVAQLERYCLGGAVITRRSVAAFREEFGL